MKLPTIAFQYIENKLKDDQSYSSILEDIILDFEINKEEALRTLKYLCDDVYDGLVDAYWAHQEAGRISLWAHRQLYAISKEKHELAKKEKSQKQKSDFENALNLLKEIQKSYQNYQLLATSYRQRKEFFKNPEHAVKEDCGELICKIGNFLRKYNC